MRINKKTIFYNKFFVLGIFFSWLILTIYYSANVKKNLNHDLDYLIFTIQFICDLLIGYYALLSMLNKNNDETEKIFYKLFFISVISGLITNESYNFIINIYQIENAVKRFEYFWTIPYFAFLISNLLVWTFLLYKKRNTRVIKSRKIHYLLLFSYVQPIVIITVAMFLFGTFKFKNNLMNIHVINSLLEISLFNLISIAFLKTKNKSLSVLEIGFLVLIFLNLAQRISYISGYYYKIFDVVWFLCLMIIIYGFYLKARNENEKIDFFENDSIHVVTGVILSIFSTLMFFVFFICNLLLYSVDIGAIPTSGAFYKNIPAVLLFLYVLSVLASKVISTFISKPLEIISSDLISIQKKETNMQLMENREFNLFEINVLHDFITETILQLESANRVKSEFIMNMSHDFRTPASGIYHMSKYIHEKIISDSRIKSMQKLVVDSSLQLITLIDSILDYSQLSNKNIEFEEKKTYFSPKELINDLIVFLSPNLTEKELDISAEFSNTLEKYYGYGLQINRILLNLISNAIKFTEKGRIEIFVKDKDFNNENSLTFIIRDTGIGMDEKYCQLIFEPFFRIESSETGLYSGLGLGLSSVKFMLKKMDGQIFVESKLGEGTTFTVIIPINRSKKSEK